MGFITSFVVALAMVVVGELLRPKVAPPDVQASSLDDFDFPTASETRNYPWMAGKCLIEGGNVTWYGDLVSSPIRKKVKTGLWKSKRVTVGHKYNIGIEMFLTIGEIEDVHEIRFGGEVPNIYTKTTDADTILFDFNDPNFFGGNEKDGGVVGKIRIHKGTQTQNANAYLQNAIGRARSAYRGLCFAAFERPYLGTRENLKPVSFVVSRYPNTLGLLGGKHKIGDDANPACMIFELLTDMRWGASIPSTSIDIANFQAIGNALHAEGMGLSMLINSARTAQDAVAEILRHLDGVMYTDTETGLLTLALARDDYDIATLPVFGPSDISSLEATRGSWAATKNTLTIRFVDREQDFSRRALTIRENGNIHVRNGEIVPETVEFYGFSNPTIALKRGNSTLKTISYPLLSTKIVMNGKGWKLRPGSVFKLNWPERNIVGAVMRVVRINYGDIVRNRIEIDCLEDIFALASSGYVIPPPSQWVNPVGAVQPLFAQQGFEVPYHMLGEEGRYAGVVAARSSGIDEGYQIWQDPAGGAAYVYKDDATDFTPTAVLTSEYPANTAAVDVAGMTVSSARAFDELVNATDAEFLAGDSLLFIKSGAGEEWMAWKTVTDNGDGTHTFGTVMRGVFDTIPLTHPAGARVWVVSYGVELLSDAAYAANGAVTAKLLPYNTRGVLPIASATQLSVTLAQRAWKPYPPAKILVDGSASAVNVSGNATVTWAIRHRLLQQTAGVVVSQDAASYTATPEGSYDLKVYVGGVLKRTVPITAAPFDTYDYTPAMRVADDADKTKLVKFGVVAKRDTFTSVERMTHEVFMLDAADPINITTTTLPAAQPGVAYSQTLAVTGGAAPYTWDLAPGSGALPDGITLSSAGVLSGTPTVSGDFSITVRVQGPVGNSDTQVLVLQVTNAPAEQDPYFSGVKSLAHMDGANGSTIIPDVVGGSYTAFNFGQLDTAQKKYGTASANVSGGPVAKAISSLSITSSSVYTVEAWVRFSALTGLHGVLNINNGTTNPGINIYHNGTSILCDNGSVGGTGPGFGTLATDQWYHIELASDGTSTRAFVDGVLQNTYAGVTGAGFTVSQILLGAFQTSTAAPMQGWIDDFRFTWGVCRHIANFTPPTAPFPNS